MATKDLNYDVAENHGHVPVMRERMADLLRPQVEAEKRKKKYKIKTKNNNTIKNKKQKNNKNCKLTLRPKKQTIN